jgi:hypothetical protein
LDLQFERYLTPWIVRTTWLWTIPAAALAIALYAMARLPAALPYEKTAENHIPDAVREEIAEIKMLPILRKEPSSANTPHEPQRQERWEGASPTQLRSPEGRDRRGRTAP